MRSSLYVEFTHALTKRPVCVTRSIVFAIQESRALGDFCTHIIANGGAIVPVAESVETARGRIYGNQTPDKPGATEAP